MPEGKEIFGGVKVTSGGLNSDFGILSQDGMFYFFNSSQICNRSFNRC
jgi:hypothetical protein